MRRWELLVGTDLTCDSTVPSPHCQIPELLRRGIARLERSYERYRVALDVTTSNGPVRWMVAADHPHHSDGVELEDDCGRAPSPRR
jgi:hypothetical protein